MDHATVTISNTAAIINGKLKELLVIGSSCCGPLGGTSGKPSLLGSATVDFHLSHVAGSPQILNHGVTQIYLIVKTSRKRIFTGSEIIKIKNVYIVTS
jgi:hypothetical protein